MPKTKIAKATGIRFNDADIKILRRLMKRWGTNGIMATIRRAIVLVDSAKA